MRVLTPRNALVVPFAVCLLARSQSKGAHELFVEGQRQVAEGHLAEAEISLAQAARLSPDDVAVLTLLGQVEGRVGRPKEAVVQFRHILELHPNVAENHLNLAIALADADDKRAALEETGLALAIAPDFAKAHLNRARLLADLLRPEEAANEFEVACRLDPKNPDGWFYWALLAREMHDPPTESRLLGRLVALQPGNDRAWFLLGRVLRTQGKLAESEAALRRAVGLNPQAGDALYMLAGEVRERDPAEAQALMQRFQATKESDRQLEAVKALGNQAYKAYGRQEWAESVRLLREAITTCGECAVAAALHRNLGLSLCQEGKLEEGKGELREALRLDPNDHDAAAALKVLGPGIGNRE